MPDRWNLSSKPPQTDRTPLSSRPASVLALRTPETKSFRFEMNEGLMVRQEAIGMLKDVSIRSNVGVHGAKALMHPCTYFQEEAGNTSCNVDFKARTLMLRP